MTNSLFNQVEEFLKKKEELSQKEEDLISSLNQNIIHTMYDLQEKEVPKRGDNADCDRSFQAHYPVLRCPENFTKENEIFYRADHMEAIFHEYILKDIYGKTLAVKEQASFYRELLRDKNGILVCINYVTGDVKYTIEIGDGLKYEFHRKFDEGIINQGKNEIFILKDNFFDNENNQNEKKFKLFLETVGSNFSITLKEIISSTPDSEIQLTPLLSAKCRIKRHKKKGEVWLKNSKLGIKLNAWPMWQITIVIQAYFASNIKLDKQEFRIWKVENDENFRKGLRFEEAVNLIKEEEKETDD